MLLYLYYENKHLKYYYKNLYYKAMPNFEFKQEATIINFAELQIWEKLLKK